MMLTPQKRDEAEEMKHKRIKPITPTMHLGSGNVSEDNDDSDQAHRKRKFVKKLRWSCHTRKT